MVQQEKQLVFIVTDMNPNDRSQGLSVRQRIKEDLFDYADTVKINLPQESKQQNFQRVER